MILSVSNDGIEWSLDFGQDSVTLTVRDLVQEMTLTSQENHLASWGLLMSPREEFLSNHLARVPVFPNQQGTREKIDEVLPSVGAQDKDTSGYQVLIWTMLNSTGNNLNWMYTLFSDRAFIALLLNSV